MAETIETLGSVSVKQSIARVELFTDASANQDDWRIVYHFEDGLYSDDGTLLQPTQFGTRRVERRFGAIKSDPDVLNVVGLIKTKGYAYRQADLDAALSK